mgnify:CR=1 FL=1
MSDLQTIRDAHHWLRWLTDRTMKASRGLSADELHRTFPIGIDTVFETLLHLLGAEMVWIGVLNGTADKVVWPTREAYPDLDAIERAWKSTRADWDRWLAAATPAECARIVERTRDGRTYRQRAVDAAMQVPTHALYHNAQISFMFRSMGKSLPDSSWIGWAREQQGC